MYVYVRKALGLITPRDLAAVFHHWVQASSNLAAKLFSKLAPPPIYVSNIFLVYVRMVVTSWCMPMWRAALSIAIAAKHTQRIE